MQCIHYLKLRYPCGHCVACRLNKQRDKKIRIMHEASNYDKKVFLTLTYNDEHLPSDLSLQKKDVQDFLKRFRKRLEPTKIRYFACGEYGDQFGRPHYHLIIFGVDVHDSRVFKELHYDIHKKHYQCHCPAWEFGFCTVAEVNEARCAYVAKYCVKKVNGKMADDYYQGRQPEFCLTSQGLGLKYVQKHLSRLKNDNFVSIRGTKFPLPRYYVDKIYSEAEKFKRKMELLREQGQRLNDDCAEIFKVSDDIGQYRLDRNQARVEYLCNKLNMKGKADYV